MLRLKQHNSFIKALILWVFWSERNFFLQIFGIEKLHREFGEPHFFSGQKIWGKMAIGASLESTWSANVLELAEGREKQSSITKEWTDCQTNCK